MVRENIVFCCRLESGFIDKLQSLILHIKSSNIAKINIYFSNICESSLVFFSLENGASKVYITFNSVYFYENNEKVYGSISKNMDIKEDVFASFIINNESCFCVCFSLIDLCNFVKCFDENVKCAFVIFDLLERVIKVSCENSLSSISIRDDTILYFYKHSAEEINSSLKGVDFCSVGHIADILDLSYIVCSNVYGRIINKATCFLRDNNNYYCINTNGRILVAKVVNTEFRSEFSISVSKNISKFLTGVNKQSMAKISIDNVCIIQCGSVRLEFSLVEQTHAVTALFAHNFKVCLDIDSIILENIFRFFNRVRGMTIESSIVLSKEAKELDVYCSIADKSHKIQNKLGILDQKYEDTQLSIMLGFDIFNLIKMIIKRLSTVKKFIFNLGFDGANNASFARINIDSMGIRIFFALR